MNGSHSPVLLVEAHRGLGGPPSTLRDLAPSLQRRRPVLVAIPNGVIKHQLDTLVPCLPTVELPWTGSRFWDRLCAQPILARSVVRLGRSAVVHANGKSALNLVAPVLRLLRRHPQVFVHFHDSELGREEASTIRLWERLGIRMVVAPVSQHSATQLTAHGLGHLVAGLLPNPIAQPHATRETSIGEAPDSSFRVAAVASRWPQKGLDIVVESAERLVDLDVIIDVFGVSDDSPSTDYFDRCQWRRRQLALDERVRLRGRVPDLPAHLAGYDCLLVTSRQESFGRVALEGMAAGIPVVAPRIDGLVEAVGEGNCLLYNSGEPQSAANAVKQLIEHPDLGAQYRASGREWVRRYSPDKVCQDLECLYEAYDLDAAIS